MNRDDSQTYPPLQCKGFMTYEKLRGVAFGGGAVLLVLVLLSGCCTLSQSRCAMNLSMVGTSDINGGGNACVVRVYELTSTANFHNATPEAFWQDDDAALGDEMLRSEEHRLEPNQREIFELEPGKETQFIGIAANLRNPDGDLWRRTFSVSSNRGKRIEVQVGSNSVSIDVQ